MSNYQRVNIRVNSIHFAPHSYSISWSKNATRYTFPHEKVNRSPGHIQDVSHEISPHEKSQFPHDQYANSHDDFSGCSRFSHRLFLSFLSMASKPPSRVPDTARYPTIKYSVVNVDNPIPKDSRINFYLSKVKLGQLLPCISIYDYEQQG